MLPQRSTSSTIRTHRGPQALSTKQSWGIMNRKELNLIIIVAVLGICTLGIPLRNAVAANPPPASIRPDLEYLKAVNQAAPPRDPQLLFLLMAQYASANR